MPSTHQSSPGRNVLIALAFGGCTPHLMVPDGTSVDAGQTFADVALAWTQGGALTACTPASGCPASGPCTQNAAVGAPDANELVLEAGGTLELAFLCSSFYERGLSTAELRFHAAVSTQASAVVAVSYDGSSYEVLGPLDATNLDLDLARTHLTVGRFVRITDGGAGGIRIDALEALH